MKTEIIPYTLGIQFVFYVAYGDLDGITDQEKRLFDDLEQSSRIDAPEGYEFSHWSINTDKCITPRPKTIHLSALSVLPIFIAKFFSSSFSNRSEI